jgi:hypothetical protein
VRIAYLSADFHRHATAYLMAELFERHDRSRFEIIGVSFGVDDKSEMRKRLVAAFDQFYDVRRKSDEEVAKLLHDRQVDIAIDLKGYTTDSRPGFLAYRPTPIQASYLGFPGTMGAEFIDYIIADETVVPFEHQPFYAEKIVHLPDCYQVNDPKRKIAERMPTRQEVELPEEGGARLPWSALSMRSVWSESPSRQARRRAGLHAAPELLFRRDQDARLSMARLCSLTDTRRPALMKLKIPNWRWRIGCRVHR